jgi:serine/threonine-protein kinase
MVEVMAGHSLIEGEPATMMDIALDPQRRPTPRTEGIAVSDAIEAVFARALALDPRARQRDAGAFWNELLAALERPESAAQPRLIETAEELEFDPTSARRPASVSARLSAPYRVPISTPTRGMSASRSPAPAPLPGAEPAPPAAAVAVAHFVPDLELTPAPASRRPSGERPVAPPRVAHPSLLELDDALLPPSLDLDLDLPADEPRAQRSVSSQRLAAVQPSAQRSSNPPSSQVSGVSGSLSAVREPLLNPLANGLASSRQSTPDWQPRADEAPRSARHSRPPPAQVSAPFELGFVAKIDPKLLQERTLVQRLRPAVALLGVAILVAILDPVYAAATGERLLLAGQRLSLLAGALLLLAITLGVRELVREQ